MIKIMTVMINDYNHEASCNDCDKDDNGDDGDDHYDNTNNYYIFLYYHNY